MASETVMWECDYCGYLYSDKDEATECEAKHATSNTLSVVDVEFDDDGGQFPNKIFVMDFCCLGSLAEYHLIGIDPCEDFCEND